MPVRVRYAPSPTGDPHVGNIRTAIFNWLLVQRERQQGNEASFIVRIEDTDQSRLVEGALNGILEALRWLGLDWDEGPEVEGPHAPYFQSQRLGLYRQAADALLASGRAYRCYCSPQRLDEMRRGQMERKESPGYDRRCRELDEPALEAWRSEQGQDVPVIRFRAPRQGTTACNDIIRGEVAFENQLLDDFVLLKSDGFPTYHLANVVDDHAMQTSHVLRAEEWLSSLPRHKLLYDALGYAPPLFAHLPMILGPDRAKLSKRHGAASALEYKRLGYLPEAMLNFLALLGWSLDSHTEVMDREQLVTHFGLDRVSKAGAIFNQEKLDWLNGVYIRGLSCEELARRMLPFLDEGLPAGIPRPLDEAYLQEHRPAGAGTAQDPGRRAGDDRLLLPGCPLLRPCPAGGQADDAGVHPTRAGRSRREARERRRLECRGPRRRPAPPGRCVGTQDPPPLRGHPGCRHRPRSGASPLRDDGGPGQGAVSFQACSSPGGAAQRPHGLAADIDPAYPSRHNRLGCRTSRRDGVA